MKPPVETEDARPQAPSEPLAHPPRGLLGLILWPLQAAIGLGLRLFASFVAGVLAALFGARATPPPQEDPPPKKEGEPGESGR